MNNYIHSRLNPSQQLYPQPNTTPIKESFVVIEESLLDQLVKQNQPNERVNNEPNVKNVNKQQSLI